MIRVMLNKGKAAYSIFRSSGFSGVRKKVGHLLWVRREARQYEKWMIEQSRGDNIASLRSDVEAFPYLPLISVVLPVYNIDEKWLRKCIDSVLNQLYPHWELCVADDNSSKPHVRRVLEEYTLKDERIKVVFRPENGHISAASNSALELATGEFVALLDHDDELSEDALYWVAKEIVGNPNAGIIYSDEDLIDKRGRRFEPKFKPEFSCDLYYSLNLMTHLSAFRTDIVRAVGGFRLGFEGSQDYDLGLRILERIDDDQVRHIPRVLYHWRAIPGSVALSPAEKPYAHDRARWAIEDHLERTGHSANVLESVHQLHRVRYSKDPGRLTLVVLGRLPEHPNRIHEVANLEAAKSDRAVALNDAVERSTGEVVIFTDDDLRPMDDGAFEELARFAMHPRIGAVGGRILSEDLFVEECGLILNDDLQAVSAHRGFPRDAGGNISRNLQIGNFSAVSVSCMAIERRKFIECGGFDTGLSENLDVDLCLRLRERAFRIVTVPQVEFVRQAPSPVRESSEAELVLLRTRWESYIARDPFWNPNLKRDGSFSIDI